jgi:hypothetical protein
MNLVLLLPFLSLTSVENHKTDSAYFNALISKNFLFKFINSYNSLFYIAFFRQFEENAQLSCSRIVNPADPTQRSCLYELAYQLGILFGTMIVVNNLLEVLFPVIQTLLNVRNQRKGDSSLDLAGERSTPEKEFNLSTYDSTLSDYEELAIQFGYVCMFVTAFPLTPLFALFNNMIEIQLDANKICKLVRRPEPRGADSIGKSAIDLVVKHARSLEYRVRHYLLLLHCYQYSHGSLVLHRADQIR